MNAKNIVRELNVKVVDTESSNVLGTLSFDSGHGVCCKFKPDGKYLVIQIYSKSFLLY